MPKPNLVSVYLDADVLFRAATASHQFTAALVALRMAEFTLVDAVTAVHTIEEAARNLGRILPRQLPTLTQLVARSIRVVDDPPPELMTAYTGQAHWKDVINLAAAVNAGSHVLLTYNVRDYYPIAPIPKVMTPGQFVAHGRQLLYEAFAS
jgi:predicted nucleic acid-binding protein